jgi:site-specific DNA-methyltransferase (adenine-specific)
MSHKRVSKIITSKDEWQTPQWLFDLLDQEFHFQVDAAADEMNSRCRWFLKKGGEFDALTMTSWMRSDWPQVNTFFLNPPYSAGNIDKFMAKALEESKKGAVVVCLVPCATDTKWWHNYAMKAQEIRFIKGRVRFVGYNEKGEQIKNSPTFSSCVVIFKHDPGKDYRIDTPWIGGTIYQPKR